MSTLTFDAGCNLSGVSKVGIRCGTYIDAIRLFYRDGQETEWFGGPGGSYHEFIVSPNDTIIAINTWAGEVVDSLQFKTKNGILSKRYGGNGGIIKTIDVSQENVELVGILGEIYTYAEQKFVRSIDFEFAKTEQKENALQDEQMEKEDLIRFINGICDNIELSSIDFDRGEIVSRCLGCFMNRGYLTAQSIFENREQINCDSDDLGLLDAHVPIELATNIYQTIQDMRNPPFISEENMKGSGAEKDAVEEEPTEDVVEIYNVGVSYENGTHGVEKNLSKAVETYRVAADRGYAAAQHSLGRCYEHGIGVTVNETEAVRQYRLAADQGSHPAQCSLAVCYVIGKGVATDMAEACRLYRLAADKGNSLAQNNLGASYIQGNGVAEDVVEGARLYKAAAEQGLSIGQYNLGGCYEQGLGVEKNIQEAIRLYHLAANQGYLKAQEALNRLANQGFHDAQEALDRLKSTPVLVEQKVTSHAELREFLNAVCEREHIPTTGSYRKKMVDRCVDCFVRLGYETLQSIVESRDYVIDADLPFELIDADVPSGLAEAIYQTIQDMKIQPFPSKVELKHNTVTSDFVPLEKLTLEAVLTLLINCEYLSLVDPFENDEIQGHTLNAVASVEELMEIDEIRIKRIVAKAFFKQLGEWKEGGGVPRVKLEAPEKSTKDTTALDPLPLKELSLDEVSALLNNCGYSNLIAPFNNYGVHGRILDVLDSIDELKEIDISIKSAKAKAFLTQLREWKTDGVPRAKLEAREMPVKISLSSPSKLSSSHRYTDFLSPEKELLYQGYKLKSQDSGQSDVWEAVRVRDNIKVALKKFRGNANIAKSTASNEVNALRNTNHPNVVEMLDFYEEPFPCLVMKFIDGPTLSKHLKENGPLDKAIATGVLQGIGEGLKHLHDKHVVHRDMKPANIILEGGELKPVLVDLGLGKTAESTIMMQGSTVHLQGTYQWMAPEMLKPNKNKKFNCSKESDVYAVGIIMWQIFTGKMPYEEITWPQDLIDIVTAGERPALSDDVTAGPDLIRLMQNCWHADPARRPTMEDFLLQLSNSSYSHDAPEEISISGPSGSSAPEDTSGPHLKECTETEEYPSNLLSGNSIATVRNDPSTVGIDRPVRSGTQQHDTTGRKTATLDEETAPYDTSTKNIQGEKTDTCPPWVSLVFTAPSSSDSSSTTSSDETLMIMEEATLPNSNQRIALLEARRSTTTTTRWIRVEYDDRELGHIMSANFVFISLANKNDAAVVKGTLDRLRARIQELFLTASTVLPIGRKEQGVWIETCPVFNELCALHFSPKIAVYDAVIQAAEELSLKPFPNYVMAGLSKCSRVDSTMWNHESWVSPFGIGLSPTFSLITTSRVKVGVIDMGFYELDYVDRSYPHVSLRELVTKVYYLENMNDVADRDHGNHVAGLIGATESSSIHMKGVCSNVELLLYAMPCGNKQISRILFQQESNYPISWELLYFVNTWIEYPHISHLIKCLSQMILDSVRVVNISLEWPMNNHGYIKNMLYGFQTVLRQQDWHFVVAAGNGSANLDSYTALTGGKVNIFSSLAALVPDRLTMVGASDMFGHNCSFSNYGTMVALSAPGEHILSTVSPPNGYEFMNGTSQSSPLLAGAVVLMSLLFPELNYHQIVKRLMDTVDIHFSLEGKSISGGRLNLQRAMETSCIFSRGLDDDVLERIRNIDRTVQFMSEEERWRAYPLRDKAFVAFDRSVFSIFSTLSSGMVLDWYDRFGGRLVVNAISSMHWMKAIESMNIACGRRPDLTPPLLHEAVGVCIEKVKEILQQHLEQLPERLLLTLPSSIVAHQIRQSEDQLQHLIKELSQCIQPLIVRLELVNQPDYNEDETRRLMKHIKLLEQRKKHLLLLRVELQGRAVHFTQQIQKMNQLAIWLEQLMWQVPQQSMPLYKWLTQHVQELNRQIAGIAPSSPIWLSEQAEHLQQKAQEIQLHLKSGLPPLEEQIEQIEGSVLPEDAREHLKNLWSNSLMRRRSILEEWESTLPMQLLPKLDTETLPTAFLRNIARLQEGRLSKRLQALREDQSKFINDAPTDPKARLLLLKSFLIDAEDLTPLSVDLVRLLRRALQESTLALGLLTPPDRFQSMRALWTNEQRWLEHFICVWEDYIADLKLYRTWFNFETANN